MIVAWLSFVSHHIIDIQWEWKPFCECNEKEAYIRHCTEGGDPHGVVFSQQERLKAGGHQRAGGEEQNKEKGKEVEVVLGELSKMV